MPNENFDARELRQVLGAFVTGVTVITTVDASGKPYGLTANSFSSVSLSPPLVLWSQSTAAPSYPTFRDAERFAVNILAEDQVDISRRFATSGGDKFVGIEVQEGIAGIPLISGCSAYLECRKVTSYPGGDHAVFLGHVERIDRAARRPLAFGGGKYLVAQPHDLGTFSPDIGMASLAHLQAVRLATLAVVELSDELDETLGLAVWGNRGPTVVRWEDSKEPVSPNLRTGVVLPILTSATGLAFAAYLPREITAGLIEEELRSLEDGWMDIGALGLDYLELKLKEIREHGLARVVGGLFGAGGENSAVNAVTAPVFDAQGLMVLALTAIGPAAKLDVDWDARVPLALKACADSLTRRLARRTA